MSAPIHVLVAVDGSDDSNRAGLVAAGLFGASAQYTFVHVAEAVPMTPPNRMPLSGAGVAPAVPHGVAPDEPGGANDVKDSARAIALAAATSVGVDVTETIGLLGDPARAIVGAATERGADVIVVGAHERGWLAELFTSSVLDDIQHLATIPVLVVPHLAHPDD
ncbi:MAG: universal stress protein [Ilumatobacteraceae bacterium]